MGLDCVVCASEPDPVAGDLAVRQAPVGHQSGAPHRWGHPGPQLRHALQPENGRKYSGRWLPADEG